MSIFSSFLNGIKIVGKSVLRMFNPFEDDGYRSASREEQDRFQKEVEIIANDKTLDHEYRMEAQRVLANIESYRHAEEMARIEGTTTITVAQIEGTKNIVIAKLDLYKSSLIRSSKKELALIDAMSKNSELIDLFIERLDTVSVEVKELVDKVELYNNEVTNLTSLSKSSPIPIGMALNDVIALDNKSNNNHREWADKLWDWEETQGINVLPRNFKSLIRLITLDLSGNNLKELPVEIGNLTNLIELYLVDNELIELPVEIGNLTNLTYLYLKDNNLKELPVEIGNLTNLVDIDLDGNNLNLKELPVEIRNLL